MQRNSTHTSSICHCRQSTCKRRVGYLDGDNAAIMSQDSSHFNDQGSSSCIDLDPGDALCVHHDDVGIDFDAAFHAFRGGLCCGILTLIVAGIFEQISVCVCGDGLYHHRLAVACGVPPFYFDL